jgi:aldose 1-epimerase
MWKGTIVSEKGRNGIRFYIVSPDGEEGFPGNLKCYVTYWLTDDNKVIMDYKATTDKPTVVNLSNHTFWNLKGKSGGYVMDHQLTVEADSSIQNNLQYCPDYIASVNDTPFDFREPNRVDYRIDMPSRQLEIMHGMSVCWCIRNYDGSLRKACNLYEPGSGRGVETWTTEPGLLTYTGRSFSSNNGKYGPIGKFGGMVLETIHFADSPNQPRFPSTILRPGNIYHSVTEYRFYAK